MAGNKRAMWRRPGTPTHLEVWELGGGKVIHIICDCPIAHDHDYAQWRTMDARRAAGTSSPPKSQI